MQFGRALLALAAAAAAALAGCSDGGRSGGPTSVMGGSDGKAAQHAPPSISDARGRTIPPPRLPANAAFHAVPAGEENALAVWIQDGDPVAAAYAPATGWAAPRPLEQLHGDATDPQVVANAGGAGMAVWRHTVGSIQSLRFSRFDPVAGWSVPDVMPGALPRPPGQASPAQLQMDGAGNVTARWPSGFDAQETQVSRYAPGQGWSAAISERVASAPLEPAANAASQPPASPP
jgi:hypothetical protein